jgi:pyruvate,water dikinase
MAVSLRETPCLTDDEVRALARLGQQVEDHYGVPQDIEWALLGASPSRFALLQSRPETVWAARDRGPIASPQAKASDHVLTRFSRGL